MKTIIAAVLFSSATILSASAQTDRNQTPKQVPGQMQNQQHNHGTDQVQPHTDRMAKDLNLNEDQKRRLHEHNNKRNQDNMQLNQVTGADRARMQQSQNDQYDNNLRDILDENQYKQYESKRSEYGNHWNSGNQPDRQGMEPAGSNTRGTGSGTGTGGGNQGTQTPR